MQCMMTVFFAYLFVGMNCAVLLDLKREVNLQEVMVYIWVSAHPLRLSGAPSVLLSMTPAPSQPSPLCLTVSSPDHPNLSEFSITESLSFSLIPPSSM